MRNVHCRRANELRARARDRTLTFCCTRAAKSIELNVTNILVGCIRHFDSSAHSYNESSLLIHMCLLFFVVLRECAKRLTCVYSMDFVNARYTTRCDQCAQQFTDAYRNICEFAFIFSSSVNVARTYVGAQAHVL